MLRMEGDPWFEEKEVITRIKNLWIQLQSCRYQWDLEPLRPYFSMGLIQREEEALRKDQEAMRMRYAGRPAVLEGVLKREEDRQGQEVLLCGLHTRYIPREIARDTEKVVREGKETFFREVWVLVRPAGTKTPMPGAAFSVNCPGCGAPFSMYKSAKCPMCNALVRVPDFTWIVADIVAREE